MNGGRTGLGKIERAEKGTIFLDEITEMPMALQARVMQVLQDKVLLRPSSDKAASLNVRVLAATSANIDKALAERKLREDLYYRLSAFTVQVPPLRQRRSEIPILLQHSMHQMARHYGLPPREFSSNVITACQNYSWPGNLRELESFVKRYLVAGDAELTFNEVRSSFANSVGAGLGTVSNQATFSLPATNAEPQPAVPRSLKSLIQNIKSEAERNAIGTALQKTGWNRKAAARLLQVSYRTLLYKIDQYHMSSSEPFLSPLPARQQVFLAGNHDEKQRKGVSTMNDSRRWMRRSVAALRSVWFSQTTTLGADYSPIRDDAPSAPAVKQRTPLPRSRTTTVSVIGNDDVLAINVWKEPEISKSVPVRSDGKISLPLVGEVQAAGRTPLKLEQDIADKLKNYISDPEVTVIVQQINSQKFNILGQVNQARLVSANEFCATVLDAIALAGGFRGFCEEEVHLYPAPKR